MNNVSNFHIHIKHKKLCKITLMIFSCVFSMGAHYPMDVWKCIAMDNGELFVQMVLVLVMQILHAGNLDTHKQNGLIIYQLSKIWQHNYNCIFGWRVWWKHQRMRWSRVLYMLCWDLILSTNFSYLHKYKWCFNWIIVVWIASDG